MSSLPPLPEAGPAEEATVLDEGKKSVDSPPAASTSSSDKSEADGEGEDQREVESAPEPVLKRHRVHSEEASSSSSGDGTRQEIVNSGISSPVKDAVPLAQHSPPSATPFAVSS